MKLYKYLDLDKCYNWKNLNRMIQHSEFWFSNNSKLNDPCDGKPYLDFDIDGEEYSRRIIDLKRIEDSNLSEIDLSMKRTSELMTDDDIRKNTKSNFQNFIKPIYVDVFEKATKFVGVLCLSEIPNDPLMWSHYANFHSGVCIELNADMNSLSSELGEKNCLASKIRYQSNRPKIKISSIINQVGIDFQYTQEVIESMYFVKGLSWMQEDEFRISKLNKFEFGYWLGNYVKILSIKPESIIFGLHTSTANIEKINSIARQNRIYTKRALYNERSFFLNIV